MDRTDRPDKLVMAEWRLARAERNVGRQRDIICGLERSGMKPTRSKELLIALEKIQISRVADLERLRKEIGDG